MSPGIHVGTSGWSYPTWRPGFYPADLQSADFLGWYARRFDTVELNVTGYRMPGEDQFRRWAEAVPDGFTFAVKMPLTRLDRVTGFLERATALGDRLGPVRLVVESPRDDGAVSFVSGSVPDGVRVVWDTRDPSWDEVEGLVRVNDFAAEPFRYIRMREPPYTENDLAVLAGALRAPAWVYFRHEDEPTAPALADRLLELLG